jgi:DHA1 family tetracycline resistance protein-like MFS transporter
MLDSAPLSPPRRAAFVFIFVTVVLDMLALGMIVPVLPKLVLAFVQGDAVTGARMYGLFGTAWALMQFLFAPVLGALSDRFGRRPVVLLSNFGLGLDYLLMANATSLGWLFVGRVVSGITSASVSTAGAYIADVTPAERRAGAFGLLGAAFGIGFVLGPAVGGLLGSVNPRLPFWVAAGLSLVNAGYGSFVLPESLPLERRSAFSWRRANPIGALRRLRSHPELFGLSVVMFLSGVAHEALPSTFVLYATYRYGWDERTVGLTLALVGVCSALVQAGLVRSFVARFGEKRALVLGLVCGMFGFAVFGFAPTGTLFDAGIPLMAFWGLSGPAAQGLMTRRVEPSAQGQLQGATSSVRGIAGLIGPGLFTFTFASFIAGHGKSSIPGAPFLLAALLLGAALLLAAVVASARPLPVAHERDA